MIRVEPYVPAHLPRLIVAGRQAHLSALVEDATYAEGLALCGPGYSAIADDGRVLCVAGVYVRWEGCALAHALLASDCGRQLTSIVRAIARLLDDAPYERIEAHVKTSRADSHRFATLLGFRRECTMRRFQFGEDVDLYARIREPDPDPLGKVLGWN